MSRYHDATGPEATFQPGSRRVLVNKLGITSKREMDRAEADALARAEETFYARLTARTRFTAKLLREMHRAWLSDIYEWAGEYRTVELEKDGFRWPPAKRVSENMEAFERDTLARLTPGKPGDLAPLSLAMAEVHCELLLIHPFRDGNGRLARWLSDVMAGQAGYPAPDYGFTGRGSGRRRANYLNAVKEGYLQDYVPLARFFESAILRRRNAG